MSIKEGERIHSTISLLKRFHVSTLSFNLSDSAIGYRQDMDADTSAQFVLDVGQI